MSTQTQRGQREGHWLRPAGSQARNVTAWALRSGRCRLRVVLRQAAGRGLAPGSSEVWTWYVRLPLVCPDYFSLISQLRNPQLTGGKVDLLKFTF